MNRPCASYPRAHADGSRSGTDCRDRQRFTEANRNRSAFHWSRALVLSIFSHHSCRGRSSESLTDPLLSFPYHFLSFVLTRLFRVFFCTGSFSSRGADSAYSMLHFALVSTFFARVGIPRRCRLWHFPALKFPRSSERLLPLRRGRRQAQDVN